MKDGGKRLQEKIDKKIKGKLLIIWKWGTFNYFPVSVILSIFAFYGREEFSQVDKVKLYPARSTTSFSNAMSIQGVGEQGSP